MRKIKGVAAKDAIGWVVSDAKLQSEGEADKAAGAIQNYGSGLNDAVRDAEGHEVRGPPRSEPKRAGLPRAMSAILRPIILLAILLGGGHYAQESAILICRDAWFRASEERKCLKRTPYHRSLPLHIGGDTIESIAGLNAEAYRRERHHHQRAVDRMHIAFGPRQLHRNADRLRSRLGEA